MKTWRGNKNTYTQTLSRSRHFTRTTRTRRRVQPGPGMDVIQIACPHRVTNRCLSFIRSADNTNSDWNIGMSSVSESICGVNKNASLFRKIDSLSHLGYTLHFKYSTNNTIPTSVLLSEYYLTILVAVVITCNNGKLRCLKTGAPIAAHSSSCTTLVCPMNVQTCTNSSLRNLLQKPTQTCPAAISKRFFFHW